MRPHRFIALAGTALAFAAAIPAQTHGPASARNAIDSTCTYIRCALAIRTSAVTKDYLIIGSLGRSEAIGLTGRSIARATANVPAAAEEARLGRRLHTASSVIAIAGGAGFLYFLGRSLIPRNDFPAAVNPARVAGGLAKGLGVFTAAVVVGVPPARRAYGHYRVAIGIYNATLPR
jgi:hypothetical protein